MHKPCGKDTGTFCVPCALGTYTAHLNGLSECLQCRVCDPGKNMAMLSRVIPWSQHRCDRRTTAALGQARPASEGTPARDPTREPQAHGHTPLPEWAGAGLSLDQLGCPGLRRLIPSQGHRSLGQTPTGRGSRTAWPCRGPPAPSIQVLGTPSPPHMPQASPQAEHRTLGFLPAQGRWSGRGTLEGGQGRSRGWNALGFSGAG